MHTQRTQRWLTSIILVMALAALAGTGCRGNTSQQPEQATALPEPTATPLPMNPRAVLVLPADVNPTTAADAQAVLAELAAGSGLEFETRPSLAANEMTADIRVVVYLSQPNDLGSVAAAAPQTQFIAISGEEWNPPGNVTVIHTREDQLGFLAGTLAAMIAPNFRAGALFVTEQSSFNQPFINGVSYFCGTCNALIYPWVAYPLYSQQPSGSPAASWQNGFNEINALKVNVLYVPPEAATAELGSFLAQQDVALIGSQPPPEEARSRWAGTIQPDGLAVIREIWPDIINGQGGRILNASFKVTDVQPITVQEGVAWASEGKLVLLNEIINLLRDDLIYPFSIAP